MRISLPDRFNPIHVFAFIAVIFVCQELESTSFLFALLTGIYIWLWSWAYAFAGGIQFPSGSLIFTNGLICVVVPVASKVLLLEPGDKNLAAPTTTMFVYTVGMLMLAVAMFFVRNLRLKIPIIPGFKSPEELKRASITCLVVGVILTAVLSRGESQEGTVLSALAQTNYFPVMAIIFGTLYSVRVSGGARSTNWVVILGITISFVKGLLAFGKTGMLIAVVAWFLTASLSGYSFKRKQLISVVLWFAFLVYYLVPYSQYVRNEASKSGSLVQNIPVALLYLSDLNNTRRLYTDAIGEVDINDSAHYYDQREGFLDRFIQIAADDELIDYTAKGNVYGLTPTYVAFASLVPHFIWRNKPSLGIGNTYAHELGNIVGEDDTTTGISFTVTADAFHQASWLGVLLLMPVIMFLVFVVIDSVVGSGKSSAFAMMMVVAMLQDGGAAEMASDLHYMTVGVAGLFMVHWTIKLLKSLAMKLEGGATVSVDLSNLKPVNPRI